MKVATFPAPPADLTTRSIGATPVGDLRTLPGAQALSVMFLRDWFDGCRLSVAAALSESLGPDAGATTMEALDALLSMLTHNGRRPIQWRALHCLCVGSDEAVIANLLHLAATGEREEAMLIGSLLLPGETLLPAVEAARIAGLGIMRTEIRDRTAAHPPTRH
ncbi:MAG: hypothetical protein AAF390_17145 [Pseudomonadota bacterium]